MRASVLIITPVHNEAAHLERLARSMAAQMRAPDLWLAIDDHSTDDSAAILERLAREIPFLRVLRTPARHGTAAGRDRLAAAAAPRAFNAALATVDPSAYAFIGKLDGDVELPPEYFERLLERFDADPALGIACGDLVERDGAGWRRIPIPAHHVHGALKLYTRTCFEAIGGVRNTLGWDSIDEATARQLGFHTRSHRDLIVRHHRPWGSAEGTLRGRARHGVAAWIVGYGPGWIVGRSCKLAAARPVGLSGAAFLWGYVRAALVRTPRVEPDLRRHVRAELRARLRRGGLRPLAEARPAARAG